MFQLLRNQTKIKFEVDRVLCYKVSDSAGNEGGTYHQISPLMKGILETLVPVDGVNCRMCYAWVRCDYILRFFFQKYALIKHILKK